MANEKQKSVFEVLSAINVNGHVEKKKQGGKELTYLSWPWAWAEVKKRYPDATYTIYHNEEHKPYFEDDEFGIICFTTVTIQGQTLEMWLPVMNGANKAMRRTPYKYMGKNPYTKQDEEKTVEAATMFDINKTIMRCLVKNLAMFGLGHYIYAGEDLPDVEQEEQPTPQPAPAQPEKALSEADIIEKSKKALVSSKSLDELTSKWSRIETEKPDLADILRTTYEECKTKLTAQ